MNTRPGWTTWLAAPACAVFAACAGTEARAEAKAEEARLIRVLRSDKGPGEKVEACRRLKTVGTREAVPALAELLGDRDLSIFARHALETVPFPEAGAALVDSLAALREADGAVRAGIVNSIGERRESESVAALVPLLEDADAGVASSAAAALGKIGGKDAARALRRALRDTEEPVRQSVVDALVTCADRLLAEGDGKPASAVYRELLRPGEKAHVRAAAYRGIVLAARDPVGLVRSALAGDDGAAALAALKLVPEVGGGVAATKAFAALVPEVPAGRRAALIEALGRRGDGAAEEAVAAALRSASSPATADEAPAGAVRLAALRALGMLGGPASVGPLAEAAARSGGVKVQAVDERRAARASLARLRGDGVRAAIIAELLRAGPAVLAELARALGARGEKGAVPELLKAAREADRSEVRLAVARALGELAAGTGDESPLAEMVDFLVRAETDAERKGIESALVSFCSRSARKEECARTVLAGLARATVPARCALLRVAGRAGGADILRALREAVRDNDDSIRDAAVRTMAETAGLDAAPDLLRLATDAASPVHRVLAVRGYWRLVGLASGATGPGRSLEERWRMCRAGMAASVRPDEKKLGLAELSKVSHVEALEFAESLCAEAGTRAEAEMACVRIAAGLAEPHLDRAKGVLRRLAARALDDGARSEAKRALDAMNRDVEYVSAWFVAGPYRQAGKECTALFDIAFPPEGEGAEAVAWRRAKVPSDPAKAWQVDLSDVVGGNHCVVYLKARVSAPRSQKVRLDIGTDDGVKLWVNGRLAHANNAVRGIRRDEDRAEAELRQGSNDILVKVTQHTLGCAAAVRIRNPDGSAIEGLRCW